MSRPHIVLVDDDQSIVRSLTAIFETHEVVVHSTTDGDRALDLIREKKPVVVILDIVLPGLNGFQLCRQLRTEFSEMPIMLFSGKSEPADKLWAEEVGADDLYQKPSDLNRLVERVVELARKSGTRRGQGESEPKE